MVNLLRTKDANSLFYSILYGNLVNKPAILPGAPGCVDFQAKLGARAAVCFAGGNDEANEILKAYDAFKNCQTGPLLPPKQTVVDPCATANSLAKVKYFVLISFNLH